VKINFDYTAQDGAKHPMYAVFSDLYPYFRFEIYAETVSLAHHQNPIGKNLCLIGRETVNWRASDTLADFIRDRLPTVLAAGRENSKDAVAGLRLTKLNRSPAYYRYAAGALC